MTGNSFAEKVAVVTGAGVGIGYEIAHQLAVQGASVLLNDVDAELAEEAAGKIRAAGGVCHGVGGDVAEVEVVRGLVETAVSQFGHLNFAIANAGLTLWADFFEYTPENFDRVLGVNLRGSYFLAQAAARQMREQGDGGRIILMSSVTGHQALQNLSAYSMTKAALEMMAKNLVIDLAPLGITINAVAPGATVTPRTLQEDANYEEDWGRVTPSGRPAYPEDIANAVLFFLSEGAAHITGQAVVVDGGWSSTSPTPSTYDEE
jgi:3-oxoacyl-[acyl-carrier protein] reductase